DANRRSTCTRAAVLRNSIEFYRVKTTRALDFSKTTFLGQVLIVGVEAPMLDFDSSSFLGSVTIDGISASDGIFFANSTIAAGIGLNRSTIGNIGLNGTEVSEGLQSEDLKVNEITVRGTTFNGNVKLSRLQLSKRAWFYESTFRGDLLIVGAKAGSSTRNAGL